MIRYFAPTRTRLGVLMAHPAAFLVLACYVGAWLASIPRASIGSRWRPLPRG